MKIMFLYLVLFINSCFAEDFIKCDLFKSLEGSKVLLNSGKIDLDSKDISDQQVLHIVKRDNGTFFANFIVERESLNTLKSSFTTINNLSEKTKTYFKANGLSVHSDKPLNLQFSTDVGSFEIQCTKIPFRDSHE